MMLSVEPPSGASRIAELEFVRVAAVVSPPTLAPPSDPSAGRRASAAGSLLFGWPISASYLPNTLVLPAMLKR